MSRVRILEAAQLEGPGSFATVRAGGVGLLITRDAHDAVHVLVNSCPHQQATVCREQAGTAQRFECPNHYWQFAPDGTFAGSRLAAATGREVPRDPAKDMQRLPHRVVDGWIEIEDPAAWRQWDPIL